MSHFVCSIDDPLPPGYPCPRALHDCGRGRYDDKVIEEEVVVRLPPSAWGDDELDHDPEDDVKDWWLRGTWTHPAEDFEEEEDGSSAAAAAAGCSRSSSIRRAILVVHGLFSWRNQMLIEGIARELSLGFVSSDPSSRTNFVRSERITATCTSGDDESSVRATELQSIANRFTDPSNEPSSPSSPSARYSVLRIDLRGNGSSPGAWSYSCPSRDITDLRRTVRYMTSCYTYQPPSSSSSSSSSFGGYVVAPPRRLKVACIIGHSAGSRAVLEYIAAAKVPPLPFVNLSGRYHPAPLGPSGRFTEGELRTLKETGRVEFKADYLKDRIRDGGFFVTAESISLRGELNMPVTVRKINDAARSQAGGGRVRALTVHGGRDDVVSFEENARGGFGMRPVEGGLEGHVLVNIEKGDHNLNGVKYLPLIADLVRTFVELK